MIDENTGRKRIISTLYGSMICEVCNNEMKYSDKLIQHHITYNPEFIIPIHEKCHKPNETLIKLGLIKYTNDEYRKFYCKCSCHKLKSNSICCSCDCDIDKFPKQSNTIILE